MNNEQENNSAGEISFGKLSFEALPEMWGFQILASLLLAVPATILIELIHMSAEAGEEVVTTANITSFLLSWKLPVVLVLGIVLILLYIVVELFAQVYFSECILKGEEAGVIKCIVNGFKSVKSFMNFTGIRTILFIVIAVPVCGMGFSISLTSSLYIPNFIMEVVLKTPLFAAAYIAAVILMLWIVFRSLFILHAVLLDKMTPSEGRIYSSRLVKEHRGAYIKGMLLNILAVIVIIVVANVVFESIPELLLGNYAKTMPRNYYFDAWGAISNGFNISGSDMQIIIYRAISAFVVIAEKYLYSAVTLICGGYLMLRITQYYFEYTGRGRKLWPERPKKGRYIRKILLIVGVFVLFAVISIVLGFFYNSIYSRTEPVKIVAHRAGGTLASENSIEGLYKAIEHGCYAAEIDVQRTKDGYYIINHDADFARLTGVAKTPQEMTLEEIRELQIEDTTGNGQKLAVPTFEEMLDVTKGKIKLFVELKGADHQMVDDLVRIIKEHDCVEDTAIISLQYDDIDYTETNYPEFETGTLFFASLGDLSKLNCDLIIMEEETATLANILYIHKGGKQAIVWTVNSEDGMYKFLDSTVDCLITDEILLAEEVQSELDKRTDLEILRDELVLLQ